MQKLDLKRSWPRSVFVFGQDEGFVEDVNNLLNTGEIPNLFPAEELAG